MSYLERYPLIYNPGYNTEDVSSVIWHCVACDSSFTAESADLNPLAISGLVMTPDVFMNTPSACALPFPLHVSLPNMGPRTPYGRVDHRGLGWVSGFAWVHF